MKPRKKPARSTTAKARGRAAATTPDLNWTENLLYRLITAPSGVAEGLAQEKSLGRARLSSVIASDERLSAEDRVDIYANMYFYRLLDVLKEDFPATAAVLGSDRFHNLVTGYLIEYPPTHFSIAEAGSHLADFIGGHPMREEFPSLADLARLERTLIEVFHAKDAFALDAEAMRAIAPRDWPALRLTLHPALRIVEFAWKVTGVLRQVAQGEEPHPAPREDGIVLVWRDRNRVYYRDIDSAERAALDAIAKGSTFAEVCETIAGGAGQRDATAAIKQRFDVWLRDAVLVRLAD